MRYAGLLAGLVVLAPAVAQADPCQHFGFGMATGPVVAPLLDGGLGQARRVCGRSEVALRGGGLILIDRPNFYGRVSAGATLEGSWAPTKTTEIFGGIELVRYDTVITSLTASNVGLGHTYVGAAHRSVLGERTSVGFNGKLVLPTATGLYREARPFGFDFGLSVQFAAHRMVHVHGQLGMFGGAAAGHASPDLRVGAAMTAGIQFLPIRRLAIAADMVSMFGYTAGVDVVAGAVALRFASLKRFGFDLSGLFPFAGRERAQAVVMLRASVRLGKISTPPR